MIEIRGIKKSFGHQRVLRGVDLTVADGETLAIIGRSGCGKSVLLKHILGLTKPDAGQLLIDGVDVVPLNERELDPVRRKFGMLFQSAALFDSMNVGENVAFALEDHAPAPKDLKDRVAAALKTVGLAGTEKKMPADLSGGMKKRVALARAVIAKPKYLLYDEPTSGIDPVTSDSINNLILQLAEEFDVTSIAVTHDMTSAFKIADRIAMLHEGNIRAAGTPDELRATEDCVVRCFIEGRAEDTDVSLL